MLTQALDLSKKMLAIVESGEFQSQLSQIERLEQKRNQLLQDYAKLPLTVEQMQDDAVLIDEIKSLTEAIHNPLLDSRNEIREALIGSRKNQKKIKAYH